MYPDVLEKNNISADNGNRGHMPETNSQKQASLTSQRGQVSPVVPIDSKPKIPTKTIVVGIYVILVLLGIGTGYLLTRTSGMGKPGYVQTATEVGVNDNRTFRDSAEGVIEKDGVDGEGTHRLIREGGPSQTAYLISSVVDMDQYIGKKVRVWGETFAAEKVSWLMDVGKIELLE